MVIESRSVEETRKFGAVFAKTLKPGDVIALDGDLGTGKTECVRGLVAALGGSAVRSPTFTIVNTYQTKSMPVYHFDFYRMADSDELFEIGFYEYIAGDGVCLIEWGTMFQNVLPENTRILRFKDTGETIRTIET
ncbi:MAG: tRNA (adenosine(37)-N6)-threonylcarbamoyltransferase complex ATPase subunit type 1 TsaE [Fibrobacterota bacterium]